MSCLFDDWATRFVVSDTGYLWVVGHSFDEYLQRYLYKDKLVLDYKFQ